MPPLITVKKPGGLIRYAVEKLIDGKRYLSIRRWYEDEKCYRDEWIEVPMSNRPLMVVLNPDNDIDEIQLKDIIQSVMGRREARRLNKPNVTLLYHEFNEMRAAELAGRKQFASAKIQTEAN